MRTRRFDSPLLAPLFGGALGILALAVSAQAQTQVQQEQQPQTQGQPADPVAERTQAREQIYGSQLMTQQERTEYRSRMRAAKTAGEREQIRAEHHEAMKVRAQERGFTLPDAPVGQRGRMGPGGMGPGGGGMGPGGGGMGPRGGGGR